MTTTVAVLGSTGSIGTQTLDVIDHAQNDFDVVALSANGSIDLLVRQIEHYRPRVVVATSSARRDEICARIDSSVDVVVGEDGLSYAAGLGDVTVNAIVGFAGVPVTMATLAAGKRLALANKESLITAAPLVDSVRNPKGATIIPVDSEHCAIFQCLEAGNIAGVRSDPRRLLITASGGPFRTHSAEQLEVVTIDQALAHPTWQMGPKITIDSSTLMNKGLEVIEAHALFGVSYDDIDVVVHPQSIVHSMVEFGDGSTIAQLSNPDMRLPICVALFYPARMATPFGAMDFSASTTLTFEPPDRDRFPCLDLAYAAGRLAGAAPAWLSAANEVAVDAFLQGRLSWQGIARVVGSTLERYEPDSLRSIEALYDADAHARQVASTLIG